MPRRLKLLLLLVPAGVVLALDVPGLADAGLPARAPGTIRIRGDPDGVGDWRIVPAFPRLRFRRPLWIGHPPDGTDRIFVMEQDGVIHAFPNRPDVRETEVVLDLRPKVYRRHNEEGLLGLAFHPDFARNRTVFLHYSANRPRRGVISRFRMNAARTRIDPKSERVILTQRQPWGNHNGGDLQFGPDGYLYVTLGDGGSGGDPLGSGQDLSTWLGSILRIDVDRGTPYAVPRDNPFVGRPGAKPEIWAYGLRNVWRFSFDRATGELWAGDVGQNAWEEIDLIEKGGNYGWNAREGKHPFPRGRGRGPFIDPVIDFAPEHARSITGGYVYRGQRWPELHGVYLYADYATGYVWGLRHDGTKLVENRLIGRGGNVSSFGEDQAGEVYFTAFDGRIYTFGPRPRRTRAVRFPRRLGETGLFTDTARMTPHPSLVPYDVNVPLWSDGAGKQRYVMLPDLQTVRVQPDGRYRFPVGTIFVKTFHAGSDPATSRRLETRLLVLREEGWAGYTYVWNEAQTDAELIDGRRTVPLAEETQGVGARWTFPSRGDCMSCHTAAAGHVLGFRPEQLDRTVSYAGAAKNQLAEMRRIGLFGAHVARAHTAWPRWDDERAPRASRVRAYLDSNCAACHQPGAPGNARIDLRFDRPLAQTGLVDAVPGDGDLGVSGARLLVPGKASRSLLYLRMNRTDEHGMPNLAHNRIDAKAVDLVRRWIEAMRGR